MMTRVQEDGAEFRIESLGFMFEMVYLGYPNSIIYSLAILKRSRINSFGSPLDVCIPDANLVFQNSSATLEQVLFSKFKK